MLSDNVKINYKKNEDDHFRVVQPRDGDVFLDVGAFDAMVSKRASDIAKDLKIIAIEPNPIHYSFINKNLEGLDYTIIKKGVGNDTGKARLNVFSEDGKGGSFIPNYLFRNTDLPYNVIEVPIDTLDNILGDIHPDFVKMDVEGFGPHVFAGFNNIKPGTQFQVEYHYNLPNLLCAMLIRNIHIIELDLWEEFGGITGAIHGVAK